MEYNKIEKEAIASVLHNLAHADFREHELENLEYKACLKDLDLSDGDFVPFPKEELQSRTFDILKHLPKEKKYDFSRMMTKIARSDGEFGILERKFVTEILDICDIPFVSR